MTATKMKKKEEKGRKRKKKRPSVPWLERTYAWWLRASWFVGAVRTGGRWRGKIREFCCLRHHPSSLDVGVGWDGVEDGDSERVGVMGGEWVSKSDRVRGVIERGGVRRRGGRGGVRGGGVRRDCLQESSLRLTGSGGKQGNLVVLTCI